MYLDSENIWKYLFPVLYRRSVEKLMKDRGLRLIAQFIQVLGLICSNEKSRGATCTFDESLESNLPHLFGEKRYVHFATYLFFFNEQMNKYSYFLHTTLDQNVNKRIQTLKLQWLSLQIFIIHAMTKFMNEKDCSL